MNFSEYIAKLCELHKAIKHSSNEVHYTDVSEGAQNGYAHMHMHYPCVVLEEESVTFSTGQTPLEHDRYIILFVDHVRDTGDADEIRNVFNTMKTVGIDFLRRFSRDKKKLVKPLERFSINEVEMTRVSLKAAALYGYAMSVNIESKFIDLDCNQAFDEE